MPKRLFRSYKVDASEVQGKGATVELFYLTLNEQERAFGGDYSQRDLLTEHVVKWNWVDNEGEALEPLPEAIGKLNSKERDFLMDALFKLPEEEVKN